MGLRSVAFCCISTGLFGYPADEAARTAVAAVRRALAGGSPVARVVFDVFSERDEALYSRVLEDEFQHKEHKGHKEE